MRQELEGYLLHQLALDKVREEQELTYVVAEVGGWYGGAMGENGTGGGRTDLDLYLQKKITIMDILHQAIRKEHGD